MYHVPKEIIHLILSFFDDWRFRNNHLIHCQKITKICPPFHDDRHIFITNSVRYFVYLPVQRQKCIVKIILSKRITPTRILFHLNTRSDKGCGWKIIY
jgi:hypothetical protein